jgi:hypothetical protein
MVVAGRRKHAKGIPQQAEEAAATYKTEGYLEQPALVLQSSQSSKEHFDYHHGQ